MGIASQAIIRQFYRIGSALTALPVTGDQRRSEQSENIAAMDHGSFRDELLFAIGFAVSRSRDLLRRIVKEHASDDARQQLAERVVKHLEQSGFEIDEEGQTLRKRPPVPLHRSPGE
jgi:hypothetical protein